MSALTLTPRTKRRPLRTHILALLQDAQEQLKLTEAT